MRRAARRGADRACVLPHRKQGWWDLLPPTMSSHGAAGAYDTQSISILSGMADPDQQRLQTMRPFSPSSS
jgi:hypothetical protein